MEQEAVTVLTSDKGFEHWGDTLHEEVMAAALLDRIRHRYHIVNIRGNSFQMRLHMELSRAPSTDRVQGGGRRERSEGKRIVRRRRFGMGPELRRSTSWPGVDLLHADKYLSTRLRIPLLPRDHKR